MRGDRSRSLLLLLIACAMLQGCIGLNAIDEVPLDEVRHYSSYRIITFGIERTDASLGPAPISMQEYHPETGDIGGCFRQDHLTAILPAGVDFALFAFSVPPGGYSQDFGWPGRYVRVRERGTHYLGDFLVGAGAPRETSPFATLRRDTGRIERAAALLQVQASDLRLPDIGSGGAHPQYFMCTP